MDAALLQPALKRTSPMDLGSPSFAVFYVVVHMIRREDNFSAPAIMCRIEKKRIEMKRKQVPFNIATQAKPIIPGEQGKVAASIRVQEWSTDVLLRGFWRIDDMLLLGGQVLRKVAQIDANQVMLAILKHLFQWPLRVDAVPGVMSIGTVKDTSLKLPLRQEGEQLAGEDYIDIGAKDEFTASAPDADILAYHLVQWKACRVLVARVNFRWYLDDAY